MLWECYFPVSPLTAAKLGAGKGGAFKFSGTRKVTLSPLTVILPACQSLGDISQERDGAEEAGNQGADFD